MNEEQLRRRDDIAIQVMSERVNTIHADILDLKNSIKDSVSAFNEAVTKLVRMEERQAQMTSVNEQTQKLVKELENRVDTLEKSQPETKRIVDFAYKAIWAAVIAVAAFVAKSVGLM